MELTTDYNYDLLKRNGRFAAGLSLMAVANSAHEEEILAWRRVFSERCSVEDTKAFKAAKAMIAKTFGDIFALTMDELLIGNRRSDDILSILNHGLEAQIGQAFKRPRPRAPYKSMYTEGRNGTEEGKGKVGALKLEDAPREETLDLGDDVVKLEWHEGKTQRINDLAIRTVLKLQLDVDGRGMQALAEALTETERLKDVYLDFTKTIHVVDEELRAILESLRGNSRLEQLQLSFSKCKFVTDDALAALLITLESALGLRIIKIDLSWCDKLTDDGLRYLGEILVRSEYLEIFCVDLTMCKDVTDEGLKIIFDGLRGAELLTMVDVNCTLLENLTEETPLQIAATLADCPQITDLALNFTLCKFLTDDSVAPLIQCLTDKATLLKTVKIDLTSCSKLTNLTIMGLNHFLLGKNFPLEELTLGFEGVPSISCLLYTSPSPRDRQKSRMPSSA
eukprot:TRINITY_DN3971_c0_g1_i2.p1 TRINITY_DN3971_c0_g1~~TRINITY_DN3971_c0_g1_i2.p1  ORF type:complete len:451 (+),score=121.84 TRINITY_DN3971_c0_g1_i2:96-1448(+)